MERTWNQRGTKAELTWNQHGTIVDQRGINMVSSKYIYYVPNAQQRYVEPKRNLASNNKI